MLQSRPGDRITTAALAAEVGVSEAALYRHFPSKAKMIEGLITFAEDALFSRITLILNEQQDAKARCRNIIFLLLSFVERNPGFGRLFVGDALQGEFLLPICANDRGGAISKKRVNAAFKRTPDNARSSSLNTNRRIVAGSSLRA